MIASIVVTIFPWRQCLFNDVMFGCYEYVCRDYWACVQISVCVHIHLYIHLQLCTHTSPITQTSKSICSTNQKINGHYHLHSVTHISLHITKYYLDPPSDAWRRRCKDKCFKGMLYSSRVDLIHRKQQHLIYYWPWPFLSWILPIDREHFLLLQYKL